MLRSLATFSFAAAAAADASWAAAPAMVRSEYSGPSVTFHREAKCSKSHGDLTQSPVPGQCQPLPHSKGLFYAVSCGDADYFKVCSDAACAKCENVKFSNAVCINLDGGHQRSWYSDREDHKAAARSSWVAGSGYSRGEEEEREDAHKDKWSAPRKTEEYGKAKVFEEKPKEKNDVQRAARVEVEYFAKCQLYERKKITWYATYTRETEQTRYETRRVKPLWASISVTCPREAYGKPYEAPKAMPAYEAPKPAYEAPKPRY